MRTERDILGFISLRIDMHEGQLRQNYAGIGRAIVEGRGAPQELIQACHEVQYALKELRYIANCEWPADMAEAS